MRGAKTAEGRDKQRAALNASRSPLYAKGGEWITCEGGHRVARFACDVAVGQMQDLSQQLIEWQQTQPEIGSPLPARCETCGSVYAQGPGLFHMERGWRDPSGILLK